MENHIVVIVELVIGAIVADNMIRTRIIERTLKTLLRGPRTLVVKLKVGKTKSKNDESCASQDGSDDGTMML